MRPFLATVLAVLLVPAAPAQTVPVKGTEATFDIASWNVENFGQGSGAATERANVAAVIRQAEIDLWALQEVVDQRDFVDLVDDLRGDGYNGVLGPDPGGGGQRLAYVYDESVVTLIAARTIPDFNDDSFAFAGRIPYEFRASVTVGDETRSIRLINFHAKAFSDEASYNRRVDAANALKEYLDPLNAEGVAIVLLGDYNDRLNQSIRSGFLSPYRPFYVRQDEYTFATRDLDPNGVTFCSNASCTSGSPIDHILFTSALMSDYEEGSGEAFTELASAVPSYRSSTADHLPVLARFAFRSTAAEGGPEAGVALLPPAPSPFREATTLRFRLDAPADVRVDVLDVLGRRVASVSGAYGAGEHSLPLDGGALAPGLYVVRLGAGGIQRTQTVVRSR